jgi:hypothetical protein
MLENRSRLNIAIEKSEAAARSLILLELLPAEKV